MDATLVDAWTESGLRHVLRGGGLASLGGGAGELVPPFSDVLAKTKVRPRFALTYFELGDDLGGRADPDRRGLWTGLIAASGVMSGKTVFAPFTSVSGDGLRCDTDSFWRLIGLLRPLYLLVFGSQAGKALFPFADDCGAILHHRNMTILFFPGPAELTPYPSEAADAAAQRIQLLG